MKVLQVSTSLNGGAGLAAERTHQALLAAGINSTLLSLSSAKSEFSSSRNVKTISRNFSERLLSKSLTIIQRNFIQKGPYLQTPLSIGIDPNRFDFREFDLIHIHSMYNMISNSSLIKILDAKVPLVITLHDQRFTSGGCHGSMGCTNYLTNCNDCPQVYSLARPLVRSAYSRITSLLEIYYRELLLITPSDWLNKIVISRFPKVNSRVIHNCVSSEILQAKNKKNDELSENKINIGFISLDLNNPYKGLFTLVSALESLDRKSRLEFRLVLIGKGDFSKQIKDLEIRKLGELNASELINEMRNLNLLVVPSDQDNLPNIMCEALCLGVPVVGSRVGGIPEILNQFDLPLFSAGNSEELSNILKNRRAIRELTVDKELAKSLFSPKSYVKNLLAAYSQLMIDN
jgi:glycosyltransferase involved in cell wall biosynthesis